MYKIKAPDGSNNLCGKNLQSLRKTHNPPLSQRSLAVLLQREGFDVDNHFIRRIELGKRFVTDIELKMLAEFFNITADALLNGDFNKNSHT